MTTMRFCCVLCMLALLAGCIPDVASTVTATPTAYIARQPAAQPESCGALSHLPPFDPANADPFQVDLQGCDLSGVDLRESQAALEQAVFNTATIWPESEKMPQGFDPQAILDLGKVSGPGLGQLHAQGITGRGVSIGIVDSPLLVEHQEYAAQLRWYEELDTASGQPAFMHGPGVASIAVGKSVGVAPEANLYYIAQDVSEDAAGGTEGVMRGMAKGIVRLLEINNTLPEEGKIQAISVSMGPMPGQPGWEEFKAALEEADAQGVVVFYVELAAAGRGPAYTGLGRQPLADPEAFASYQAGAFWANYASLQPNSGWIFVPMDARTLAAPSGIDQYAFYRAGGLSWGPPYLAGMYALAVQVDPTITPGRFWDLVQRTGFPVIFPNAEGVILDAAKLIEALRDPLSIPTLTPIPAATPTLAAELIVFPKIDRHPAAEALPRQLLDEAPVYDSASMNYLELNLVNADLSSLDLSATLADLRMASFDTQTTWPSGERLPANFNPQQVLEWGKNPGPGVRTLHEQGITGSGVGIAFIGAPILVDHQEFAGRFQLYEEGADVYEAAIDFWSMLPVSAAAGATSGVAPGADIYYIATTWGGLDKNEASVQNFGFTANAILRLLDINAHLPQEKKIRVIVLMNEVKYALKGKAECQAAIQQARADGILVIEKSSSEGFQFLGLGRDPLSDPESFDSYLPWGDLSRWEPYTPPPDSYFGESRIFFPSDSRTLADVSSTSSYTFGRQSITWQTGAGGYIAGAYALAAQLDPAITPARFFDLAVQTGRSKAVDFNGQAYNLGPILDLPALLAAVKAGK